MSELSPGERVSAWEELQQNAAWAELCETIRQQRESRAQVILRDVSTPDNMYDRERIRGEWAGLELVLEYAATLYEVAQQDRDDLAKETDDVQK